MKRNVGWAISLVSAVALSAGAGYWLGTRDGQTGEPAITAPVDGAAAPQRKLLYYRNPMGLPDTSLVPKKDPMGMDYIAVYEGEEDAGSAGAFPRSGSAPRRLTFACHRTSFC